MKALFCIGLIAAAATLGCGPQLDRNELGTIVSEPPRFDPYDEKYPLPQLDPSKSGEKALETAPDGSETGVKSRNGSAVP